MPLILTWLVVINDVFAEQVIVAKNYRGAQYWQALLEPHQLLSENPVAGHLRSQPGGGRKSKGVSIFIEEGALKAFKKEMEVKLVQGNWKWR